MTSVVTLPCAYKLHLVIPVLHQFPDEIGNQPGSSSVTMLQIYKFHTTLFDNTDIFTCPGRPLPLISEVPWAFHQSGGSQWFPCPPYYLLSFSPQHAPKLPSLHFPIILYINVPTLFLFAHPLLPNCIHPLSASLSPHFHIFLRTIYGCPPLLMPLPTFMHNIGLFSHTLHVLLEPSHSFAPLFPPTTHFLLFNAFLDVFLCSFQL